MAARLRAGEPAAKSIRRIVRREAKKAAKGLARTWPPTDEAVHDARKRIKKARAALRLLRKVLGVRRYPRENQALRDAARPLSQVRDAKILVETLDALVRELARADRRAVARVRSLLIAHQVETRRHVFHTKIRLEAIVAQLRAFRRRASDWPTGGPGWSTLGAGIERVYRRGRDAFVTAGRHPTVENLHEWRKQSKYLWHQLEILQPIRPRRLEKDAKQLHQLSDRLGEDHDLAVLGDRIARARRKLGRRATVKLEPAFDRKRRALQAKASALGARIYRERPREFVARLRRYWKEWRSK
jgi:CHAD domain-containing protein